MDLENISLAEILRGEEGNTDVPGGIFDHLRKAGETPRALPLGENQFDLKPEVQVALSTILTQYHPQISDRLHLSDNTVQVDARYKFGILVNPEMLPVTWSEDTIKRLRRMGFIAALGFNFLSPDPDGSAENYLIIKGLKSGKFNPDGGTVGKEYNYLLGWQWRQYLLHLTEQLMVLLNSDSGKFPGIIIPESNSDEDGDRRLEPRDFREGNKPGALPRTQMQRLWEIAIVKKYQLIEIKDQERTQRYQLRSVESIVPDPAIQEFFSQLK